MVKKDSSVMPRVFISHSHKDRTYATDLQRILTRYGAQAFLDQDKIQVADVLPDRIQQGIDWCDTLLLIWSSSAAVSDWVEKEWNSAYELRKKIVPYCLDSTSLPPALENLVYVDRKDAQVAHVGLLRSVFGKGFMPPTTDVFPGRWRVTLNAFGLGTVTHDLELRANGQITGSAKMDQGGIMDNLVRTLGAADLLNIRPSVSGTWEYEESTEILTLDIATHGFGQEFREKVQVRATGHEDGEIQGKDLSGRTYVIRRMPGSDLKASLLQLEEEFEKLASLKATPEAYQQQIDVVLSTIFTIERHRSVVNQTADPELTDQFEKICKCGPVFEKILAAEEPFAARALIIKGLALVMARQDVPKFRGMCFRDE